MPCTVSLPQSAINVAGCLFIPPSHDSPSHHHSPRSLCPGSQVVATYHGDHAFSFDTTGAAAPAAAPAGTTAAAQQRAGGGAPLPVNLFEHPTAMAALVARNRGGAGGSGGGSGTSSGFTSSGSGGMGDLPGMLPAAAERAKADGNLHLFSKKVRLASRGALPVARWTSSFSARALLPACATLASCPRLWGLLVGPVPLSSSPRHASPATTFCRAPARQFYEAERRYSEAIRLAPWAPVLYTNRYGRAGMVVLGRDRRLRAAPHCPLLLAAPPVASPGDPEPTAASPFHAGHWRCCSEAGRATRCVRCEMQRQARQAAERALLPSQAPCAAQAQLPPWRAAPAATCLQSHPALFVRARPAPPGESGLKAACASTRAPRCAQYPSSTPPLQPCAWSLEA